MKNIFFPVLFFAAFAAHAQDGPTISSAKIALNAGDLVEAKK
jgi:hypothetical protein